MSRTRWARRPNSSASSAGTPEQLDQRGARGGEPFRHLRRHGRVVGRALPFQLADLAAHPAGGDDEDGQQHHGQHRDDPREPEHDDQGQGQGDDVGDHPGQRRGEGALGTDDVVVEPADQGPGAGAGEERHRHLLHVFEHGPAQVDDEALTEAGRTPAGQQPHDGVDHGDDGDEDGEADDGARRAALDDGVDRPAGQHRGGHAERGRHRGQAEEGDEGAAVRAGEGGHAAQRVPPDVTLDLVVLHGAAQRMPGGEVAHRGPYLIRVIR